MRFVTTHDRMRLEDTLALLGIVAGMGMLFPVFFVPEMAFLAVPALVVLMPSMLVGMQ
jgi:hypothetical protein